MISCNPFAVVGFKTTLGPRVVVRATRPQSFYVWCCPTTTTTIFFICFGGQISDECVQV